MGQYWEHTVGTAEDASEHCHGALLPDDSILWSTEVQGSAVLARPREGLPEPCGQTTADPLR